MAKIPTNNSGRGQRELRVKVKTARGRKLSSTIWLERQLNDPYVKRSQVEGYRGRAAFKILELDDKVYDELQATVTAAQCQIDQKHIYKQLMPHLGTTCTKCCKSP